MNGVGDILQNMINKIIKERRRSMNAAPTVPVTRASGKEPRRTPNKNREGHKAEYGQANHYLRTVGKGAEKVW
jgi:hypothetical protein